MHNLRNVLEEISKEFENIFNNIYQKGIEFSDHSEKLLTDGFSYKEIESNEIIYRDIIIDEIGKIKILDGRLRLFGFEKSANTIGRITPLLISLPEAVSEFVAVRGISYKESFLERFRIIELDKAEFYKELNKELEASLN